MKDTLWLLFIYQVPAAPSTHRSYIWRKLKAMGALYLQNSICLLPYAAVHRGLLDGLRAEIGSRGGQAQLFHVQFPRTNERRAIRGRYTQQAGDEYGEFLEQCRDFHVELEKERGKNHLTFGELEENDAELTRLRTWLVRIQSRDFFQSAFRKAALRALAASERDFALFERQVEKESNRGAPQISEGPTEPPSPAAKRRHNRRGRA